MSGGRPNRYYATVPSGFEAIGAAGLSDVLSHARILATPDGAIEFESAAPVQRVSAIRFFQNVFLVLRTAREPRRKNIAAMMHDLARGGISAGLVRPVVPKSARSFRIVTSKENRLVRVNPKLRQEVERRFAHASKLSLSRSDADLELWFLERRENRGYVLLRLRKRRATEKQLHKGQLKPEVAQLLCLASEPTRDDSFMDPFCGYGAIVLERLELSACETIRAIDNDPQKLDLLRSVLRSHRGGRRTVVHVERDDSRVLRTVPDAVVSAVVTDPPWGHYEGSGSNVDGLYRGFLPQLCRVCTRSARGVLLLHRDNPVERLVREADLPIRIVGMSAVLISGKKATVMKMRINPD